jgi:phage terminase large subunit-like protein
MKHSMPERVYQQEIQAIFVEDAGGIFRRVMDAATSQELLSAIDGHQYIAGVDIATLVDYTVAVVIDVAEKRMVYMDRFNRVSYETLEDRLQALYRRFKLDSMVIESNSVGQPVIDALANRGMNIIPFTTTNITKQTAIQLLQAAFEHGNIRILNDPVLIGELQAFEGQRTPSGSWKYSAPENFHDDCVLALCIAWQAMEGGNLWLIS